MRLPTGFWASLASSSVLSVTTEVAPTGAERDFVVGVPAWVTVVMVASRIARRANVMGVVFMVWIARFAGEVAGRTR